MQNNFLYIIVGLGMWLSQPLDGQIALGQWRTHLPYKYCNLVEVTNDRVYCSATGGLFYYNLEDNSVEKISKIDGLSDNGISAMRWSGELETLILAYQNSNLDIIRDGVILNLPDIMKKQIPGDKSINDIYFLDQRAYLSTGFGIVLLNLVISSMVTPVDQVSSFISPASDVISLNFKSPRFRYRRSVD